LSYTPKTEPFPHQREILEKTRDLQAYALFWEMGVAKTKPVLDTIGHLYCSGEINGAVVLAPKAVAPNWVNDEMPEHLGIEAVVFLWDTSKANGKGYQQKLQEFLATPPNELAILVMSYDAIMTERKAGTVRGVLKGREAAKKLLLDRRCMMVLDESARIKGPDTKRTKRVLAAGKHAKYRRIMTGTPVANSPFDVYTQLRFLDPDIWKRIGCGSYAAFKAMFGVWVEHVRNDNGQKFQTLVDFQNLAILNKIVDEWGSRLLLEDVLDLPPKSYEKRTFVMAPAQRKLYDELKKEFIVWLDNGDIISAPLAITRMLRLQQVTSGYCPTDDGSVVRIEPNARLSCLMDTLEDVPHQALVWGKFQDDIDQISEAIGLDNCVVYDGRVSQVDREERRRAFKRGDGCPTGSSPRGGPTVRARNTR
jgi:SNF2 family DNA or RNA helicase